MDIQFIQLVDELQVLAVEEVSEEPRTLRVRGQGGFFATASVLVNEVYVSNFTVVSDTTLFLVLDSRFDDAEIDDLSLEVVSSELTDTTRARLVYGPSKHLRYVSGPMKLIQQVTKSMLSRARSNAFYRAEGGNLLEMVGGNLQVSASSVAAGIAQAISATEELFQATQSSRALPANERLRSLTLEGLIYNDDTAEASARVKLRTMAGLSVEIPLYL